MSEQYPKCEVCESGGISSYDCPNCHHKWKEFHESRTRELEQQVESLTADRNERAKQKSEFFKEIETLKAENAALRAVLRELPAWEIMRNRRRLRDHIAAACKERGVELEDGK